MLAKDYQVSFQCHFNGTQTSKQSDMEEYEDANSCYVVVSVDEFEYLLSIYFQFYILCPPPPPKKKYCEF